MLKNKKSKIIIITGGLGFLGKHFVKTLAKDNHVPIILDKKSTKEINSFVTKNRKSDNLIDGYHIDITNEKNVKKLSSKIFKKYKKIDILINNAANNPIVGKKNKSIKNTDIENFSLDNWNNDIKVGLTGSFLVTKYFGKLINKNKNGGSIINISSDLGLISPDQRLYSKKQKKPISYSVVKSGILGLNKYFSTYWPKKIRSNALCFGGVLNNQNKNFLKKVNKLIPMGRLAYSYEYNGIISFLCSDNSTYLNGSVITVDGGRTSW